MILLDWVKKMFKQIIFLMIIVLMGVFAIPEIFAQEDSDCREKRDYFSLGVQAFEEANQEDALTNFNCVLEANPNNVEALRYRGIIYSDLQNYPLALADFDRVIQLAPEDFRGYYHLGRAYYETETFDNALADFEMAISFSPEVADLYLARGQIYTMLEAYELALQDFEQALSLNPNLIEVYNARGSAYYKMGELDKALEEWDYYVSNHPLVFEVLSQGFQALEDENYLAALNYFSQLWLVSGSNPKYHLGLGHAYYGLGLYTEALTAYTNYVELSIDSIELLVVERIEELEIQVKD